jgi:hypothetical protein
MFSFCFFNQSAEIVAERKNPPPPPRPKVDPNPPHLSFVDHIDRPRAWMIYTENILVQQQKWDAKYGQQADVHSTGNVLGAHKKPRW